MTQSKVGKISPLDTAAALAATDLFTVEQSGFEVKSPLSALKTFANAGNGAILFAALPVGAADGYRAVVSDSTKALTGANLGTAAAGGGALTAPVLRLSGAWVIG